MDRRKDTAGAFPAASRFHRLEAHGMSQDAGETTHLLGQLRSGDEQARSRLIGHAQQRLIHLARKMLRGFPGVRRWEETGDVSQEATIRFDRTLSAMTPESSCHFWNLLTAVIRRVLLDLARHYQGPEGFGANHHTDGAGRAHAVQGEPLQRHEGTSGEPHSLVEWTQFHEHVEALPDQERDVFNLLWYGGLTQEEAAKELHVALRTVRRRWLSARSLLAKALPSAR